MALGLAEPAEHSSRGGEIAHRDRREVDSPIQPCPYRAALPVVTFIGPVVLTPTEDTPTMSPIELRVLTFFLATRASTHGDLHSVGCSRNIALSRQSNIDLNEILFPLISLLS